MEPQTPTSPAAKTGQKQVSTRFKPGQSGNPAGRPFGSRHKSTLAVEALLDGEAEKLTRKAVEMALAGDTTAMRLCLERLCPPRKDRPVVFAMPAIENVCDVARATSSVISAVACGDLSPMEGVEVARLLELFTRASVMVEFEQRIKKLEEDGRR